MRSSTIIAEYPAIPKTVMDIYRALPEGTLAEIIDNTIYMSPAPISNHQRIIGLLYRKIANWLEANPLAEIFLSPIDVYLDEVANAVQPDLTIVLSDQSNIVDPEGAIHGVPAIMIEVLSKGNKKHDLVTKKDRYERFGVKEYFVIDPDSGLVIHYFLQENGSYITAHEHLRKLQSSLLGHTFEW